MGDTDEEYVPPASLRRELVQSHSSKGRKKKRRAKKAVLKEVDVNRPRPILLLSSSDSDIEIIEPFSRSWVCDAVTLTPTHRKDGCRDMSAERAHLGSAKKTTAIVSKPVSEKPFQTKQRETDTARVKLETTTKTTHSPLRFRTDDSQVSEQSAELSQMQTKVGKWSKKKFRGQREDSKHSKSRMEAKRMRMKATLKDSKKQKQREMQKTRRALRRKRRRQQSENQSVFDLLTADSKSAKLPESKRRTSHRRVAVTASKKCDSSVDAIVDDSAIAVAPPVSVFSRKARVKKARLSPVLEMESMVYSSESAEQKTDSGGVVGRDVSPESYEVECIMLQHERSGVPMDFVKWKGYETDTESSWEPSNQLQKCNDAIRHFQARLTQRNIRKFPTEWTPVVHKSPHFVHDIDPF